MNTLFKRIISIALTFAVFGIFTCGKSLLYTADYNVISGETAGQSEDYSLSISDAQGNPGDKVTVDIIFSGQYNLDAIDAVVKWEDTSLKANAVTSVSKIGISSIIGSKYITFAGFSSDANGVSSGSIITADFIIPEDVQPGTVYDLTLTLNALGVVDEDGVQTDLSEKAVLKRGTIKVSEGAVTTAVSSTEKPDTTTATTVTTVSASATQTTDVTETSNTAVSSSVTPITTIETSVSASAPSTTEVSVTTPVTSVDDVTGDADLDGKLSVRDAALIAHKLALGQEADLPARADFNGDNIVNVRDAAAIARYLANEYRNE